MNKAQKEVIEAQLRDEKQTLNDLKKVFEQAKADCSENIAKLNSRKGFEPENLSTIIYQQKYQEAISEQVDGALKHLNDNQYKTINDYVQDSYHNGYTGIMYDLHKHNIPIIMPIDQEQVTNAIQINSKISQGMYSRLGEDVDKLKDNIRFEVSRGIANGSTWVEVGEQITNGMNSPFDVARNNAMRIARTEGHRVQEEAGLDAMRAAKEAGADVVKQWSATLDERTRPEHQEADGQIREIEEPFDVGGEELMMPGDGSAFNCINCRCTANMRARAALDESDLERLKERAKFYGLDKTKDFDDFKKKYLKIPDNGGIINSGNDWTISPPFIGIKTLDNAKTLVNHGIDDCYNTTNPNYKKGPEYQRNCQRCVYAYEARRRGYDVEAQKRSSGTDTLHHMRDPKGWPNVVKDGSNHLEQPKDLSASAIKKSIETMMSNYGDGSRAIVRVQWQSGNGGHVFIAEQEGQTTHFIDPQAGVRDCSDYFNPGRIKTSKTFLLRIDDKEFTDLVERCVQKVIK